MDRIAFIINETFLYWGPVILTLAVVTAICFFLHSTCARAETVWQRLA